MTTSMRDSFGPGDPPDSPAADTPSFSLAYFRNLLDGAAMLNRDGRVSFINQAACKLLGITDMASVHGRRWWELWPEHLESVLEEAFGRATQHESLRLTVVLDSDAGAGQSLDIMSSPVVNSDGEVESVFIIIMAGLA